jgi:uncharacterized protein (TIGR02421 family)
MNIKKEIHSISQKLNQAAKGISVIGALSWKPSVKKRFFESNFEELPIVGPRDYYDLSFDPIEKIGQFQEIIQEIEQVLGEEPVGIILKETAEEWITALRMIQARGTAAMHEFSIKLYGHPNQKLVGSNKTVLEAAKLLHSKVSRMPSDAKSVSARDMKTELEFRLGYYFGEDKPNIHVAHGLDSDAAAGDGMIVIRGDANLTTKDIDVFEVHEGWVHIGVEVNGRNQPYAKWLERVTPRTEGVQEGLAAFVEFITGATYPKRIKKLTSRVIVVDMVEKGANFLDIFHWHRKMGMDATLAWNSTERVFKGGLVNGFAPFTRDISYLKNMLGIYVLVKRIMNSKHPELLEQLFNGYIVISDIPVLRDLQNQGVVVPPKHVPEIFKKENIKKLPDIMASLDFLSNAII